MVKDDAEEQKNKKRVFEKLKEANRNSETPEQGKQEFDNFEEKSILDRPNKNEPNKK